MFRWTDQGKQTHSVYFPVLRPQPFGVEGRRAEDVIQELRTIGKTDLDGVVAVALSHSKAGADVRAGWRPASPRL